jgi:hypothetical protein
VSNGRNRETWRLVPATATRICTHSCTGITLLGLGLALAACAPRADDRACAGWSQWAQSAGHGGSACISGQTPARVLATITVDPFGQRETVSGEGLRVHYQVPLTVGDDVYVLSKSGRYAGSTCDQPDGGEVGCYAWSSEGWNETRYHWSGTTLTRMWSVASDWKPLPTELVAETEPLFQPVVVGALLYLPGAGGTLQKFDRMSGALLGRVGPPPDPDSYVSGPLTSDGAGNVYYNVLRIDHDEPRSRDAKGWLVRVDPADKTTTVSYDLLVPGAPTGTICRGDFFSMSPPPSLPWPPSPQTDGAPVLPPLQSCGSQRPGINVAPAVAADGTIFTVSRAHFNSRYSYVVAVAADLTPRWAASFRGLLADGCGQGVAPSGDPDIDRYFACRSGASVGVDPVTNELPAGRVLDASSSSPVALPDGGVLYASYSGYNGARGHLFKFAADGTPAGSFDFGWDYTPAVWLHDASYSIIVKDNHYGTGEYLLTQLDPGLRIEWSFRNRNTQSCTRASNGSVTCVNDHPQGFEWCLNAPAVDKDGTVYAGGEDGVVYAVGQGGGDRGHLFLETSLGSGYTPVALDYRGRIYAQNAGQLVVVGN